MSVTKNKRRNDEDRETCRKTKRRAIHTHNPYGTKMIRKFYVALKQDEDTPEIMEATLAGYYKRMSEAYEEYMKENHPRYMARRNAGRVKMGL